MQISARSPIPYLQPNGLPRSSTDGATKPQHENPKDAGGVSEVDFGKMTRKELADWINDRLRAGDMTLDESSSFVGMTMSIPVDGSRPAGLNDTDKIDFFKNATEGLQAARQRGDTAGVARLDGALRMMERFQGQVSKVDLRA
jgi:hypothetical protein